MAHIETNIKMYSTSIVYNKWYERQLWKKASQFTLYKKSVTRSTSSYKQNSTKICSAVDTSIHGKKRMQINRKSLWQKIFSENTEQSQTRGKKTQIPHSNPIKEAIFESHLFLSDQQKISKGWKLKNSLINHQFDWTLN